ncbi:DUF5979 domain-containing protein [Microbacterium sp. NPDC058389]|uniref:DUF5979 domain-containing protein n=1 Tax=Microbacterium sp. NPDC058389 TaxID=3346475 RepID=UPI00365F2312
MTVPAAANAAPNASIAVGNVTIVPADAQATVGDTLTVSGEWDATTANPQAGDTFTIGLPPELSFPQPVPFPLMGADAQGDPVVWGTCLTDPGSGTATCELTDAVTAAPELVRGTWAFEVEATKATTAESVVFDLNGDPVPVPLPGGGGIDDGIELPGEVSKSGVMNQNNWSMAWTVDIPGANMAGQSSVTLRDTLGAGHQLCSPTGLKVETVRGSTVADVTNLVTSAPNPGATDFTLVLTAPQTGFDPNVTYRVTYQTCTPDGQIDPEGTTYDNSAQVEGWGEAGVGIGHVQNLPWQQSLTKAGNVLGGTERNGKIAWTVTVPGSQFLGKDEFTLTETLGAGHEICSDTTSGLTITERYGPSNQLQKNITGLLTATTVSSSSHSFQLRFAIDDPQFAFKDSDYRYVITYTTCVTSKDLPAGGTAYANTVDVDGKIATNQAAVPDRQQGKGGRINTSTVTIDGVQHMPQTTLGWTVTIPGQMIEDVQDVLTLIDTFSATQTVCTAGDPSAGLAARLNLHVEARDQIQNGGLTTVDLSDLTQPAVTGNELTLEIEATDLPIPTGTSDGFTREYQYVITYTTCTASGGMDAPGTTYGNTIAGSGIHFETTTTQNNSASGTGQGVTRGSVSIDKVLADTPGAELIPDDTTFTVHLKEIDPTGTARNEYDLQVPLNGAPVSGLNARGTGWTVELTEPAFPTIPGVTFGSPVFAEGPGVSVSEDGSTATASIDPGINVSVTLANTAMLGSISIVKALDGPAADLVDPERVYQVTAQIDTTGLGSNVPAQPARKVDVTAGVPVVLEDLPVGSTVTFTEARPADDDTFTWAEPVFSPASVVVGAEHTTEPATVTLTNSVSRTTGTFTLTKTVTGDQADNPSVPDNVTVTASWNETGLPESATFSVPTDGTPVPFDRDLLIGTQVTLTETPLTNESRISWGAPVWSGPGVAVDGTSAIVTIGRNAGATVNLENHATTSTAGITLIKGIAGEAAGEVESSTEFPVTATWTDSTGSVQSRHLTINAVEPTPLGVPLPAGTIVTITEGTRPGIDTVIWGSITISGDHVGDNGDGSATVTASDMQDDVTLITVTNEATWAPGTFSLTKHVAGVQADHADIPETVTVLASWTEGGPQSAEISVPTNGKAVTFSQQLPHGIQVTLSEVAPGNTPQFGWASPTWGGDNVTAHEDGTASVTIGAATTAEVELTNTALASVGSLTITKSVTGTGAALSKSTVFPVTLTWTDLLGDQQTRTVDLIAGTPVTIDGLPVATEVHLQEHAGELADSVRWAAAHWLTKSEDAELTTETGSAFATITLTEATAELALENTLIVAAGLAATGAELTLVWGLTGAAVVALLAGALVFRARRRMS